MLNLKATMRLKKVATAETGLWLYDCTLIYLVDHLVEKE